MDGISVIIPTWNRVDTLIEAVNSVLEQTLQPLEILVCDDGSTDDTKIRINAFGDPRVRLIEGERGGLPAVPRNRGIRASRGEWLAFLDDDDIWLPDKLERQVALATESGCRAVCSNAYRLTKNGVVGNLLDYSGNQIALADLLDVNLVICSSSLIHSSLLGHIGYFCESSSLKALEDYAYWLRVASLTDFAYVDKPMLCYRDVPSESIRKKSLTEPEQREIVFRNFLEWCKADVDCSIMKDPVMSRYRKLWLKNRKRRLKKIITDFFKPGSSE